MKIGLFLLVAFWPGPGTSAETKNAPRDEKASPGGGVLIDSAGNRYEVRASKGLPDVKIHTLPGDAGSLQARKRRASILLLSTVGVMLAALVLTRRWIKGE